jgi:hypothetical protein
MKMLIILFGAAAGVAATISVGAGVAAGAPYVVGQTYQDAKNSVQAQGAAVTIATRTPGRCPIPTRWVALNCNAEVASPGSPGSS